MSKANKELIHQYVKTKQVKLPKSTAVRIMKVDQFCDKFALYFGWRTGEMLEEERFGQLLPLAKEVVGR